MTLRARGARCGAPRLGCVSVGRESDSGGRPLRSGRGRVCFRRCVCGDGERVEDRSQLPGVMYAYSSHQFAGGESHEARRQSVAKCESVARRRRCNS